MKPKSKPNPQISQLTPIVSGRSRGRGIILILIPLLNLSYSLALPFHCYFIIRSMFRSKPIEIKEEPPPSQNEEDKRNAFIDYARQSGLLLEDWHRDSLLVPSRRGNTSYFLSGSSSSKNLRCLPTDGSVVHLKSSLFEGKIITRIRDDNIDDQASNKYFRHRSRQYNWIVQGKFLHRTRFDDVITGQEFERPFRNKPSSQTVQSLLGMLKSKLPDSFECDFLSDAPFFQHPLLAGCQHFRIDKANDLNKSSTQDELHGLGADGNIKEDTSLLNDDNIPKDGAGRRKFFSKQSNLSRFFFEPDMVYTFDFFSNYFSPSTFSLEIGPMSIDLVPYFNGFPLFLSMAKDKSSGEYLWATEIWHKRLLNYQETPGRLSRWCW